ncbi:hypothetical protein [Bradyrhizobium cosmicum]|uniref:hypothetical protein n=1 Tax=Bradyrhizobium cosmicum TaxID=1404864 RepID=UPI0028EAD93B|nr:hypothetical protein [Bradyrhizobium cosmicum]
MRDSINNLGFRVAIAPGTLVAFTAAPMDPQQFPTPIINGTWIDRRGFDSLTFCFAVTGMGLSTGDPTKAGFLNFVLHDAISPDYSDAALVAETDQIVSGWVNADGNLAAKVGYLGDKKFVRLSLVPSTVQGATKSSVAVIATLGNATALPVL